MAMRQTGKPFGYFEKSTATVPLVRKSFEFSTKDVNEPKGIVSAAVNAIGVVDMQKDQMEPGSWRSVINKFATRQQPWPSVLVGHEWSAGVGVVKDAYEGSDHLYIDAKFNMETQAGRDAFSNARLGVYKNWSVGFMPGDVEYDTHGVRHVKTVDVWPEVSLVLVGASPGTRTLATKSLRGLPQAAIDYIVDRLSRELSPAEPILTPKAPDQPTDFEVQRDAGLPWNERVWVWDESAKRYVRRRAESSWGEVRPVNPLGPNSSMDDIIAGWMSRWGKPPVPSDK